MHQFSDSDTTDSEDGIRFKTQSTRKQHGTRTVRESERRRVRSRSRSKSPKRSASHKHVNRKRHRRSEERHSHRHKCSRRRSKTKSPLREEHDKYRRKSPEREEENSKWKRRKRRKSSSSSSNDAIIDNRVDLKKKLISESKNTAQKPGFSNAENASAVSIGPALPPHFNKQDSNEISSTEPTPTQQKRISEEHTNLDKETEALEESSVTIGPSLPPQLREQLEKASEDNEGSDLMGPALPPHMVQPIDLIDSDDEGGSYGPLPPDAQIKSTAHVALEERALQMKLDLLNPTKDDKAEREEWMLELPAVRMAGLGLGPRQFRSKQGPDLSDRSSWTDTPSTNETSKKKTVDLRKEAELAEIRRRDIEQEEMSKNHRKKHKKQDKSLLEQHQAKLEKTKKEEEKQDGANVRRPFNREIDLKVNHFDEAQKKAIFKKAQMLDDRFSKGQSKYL